MTLVSSRIIRLTIQHHKPSLQNKPFTNTISNWFKNTKSCIILSNYTIEEVSMIRDTYKYYFKVTGKIVHAGITNDLARRESEHRQSKPSWKYGRIEQVGNVTTREAALEWEAEQRKKGMPVGP